MKAIKQKMLWCLLVVCAGGALLGVSISTGNRDTAVTGFGVGLIIVGLLKILQFWRISKNSKQRQQFEMQQQEERLIMLAEKSGRLTLVLTLMAELVASFVLMWLGKHSAATILCSVAALQTLLYLLLYFWFSKKY